MDFEEQKAGKSKLEVSLSDTQNALIKCRRDLKDAHNKIDGLMADISAYADSERRSKEEVKLAHSAIQKVRDKMSHITLICTRCANLTYVFG